MNISENGLTLIGGKMMAGTALGTPPRRTQEVQAPMPNDPTPEEWRSVASLGGKYSVSNHGRIRRDAGGQGARGLGFILKTGLNSTTGYPTINPRTGGYQNTGYVHLYVAEAFLPPASSPSHEINHIDGDKTNPRPENLEWVTHRENALHARDMLGRDFGAFHRAKTHCPQGHPYSGANLYVCKRGKRMCRACGIARTRARRAR